MKRIVLALVVLAAAGVATAQESYAVPATANQVTRLSKFINRSNANVCNRYALPTTCTQAEVCTAANAPGGAACTPAQAENANVRIYPDTQPGRQEVVVQFAKIGFTNADNGLVAFDQSAWCTRFKAATQAQRDASCTSVGYVAGCEPCSGP